MYKSVTRSRPRTDSVLEAAPFRSVATNVYHSEASMIKNKNIITTTKYSWYSWLPISILEQFRRIANIYFLVISILMIIGTYSTTIFTSPLDPWSTVMTLCFVLMVTSIKEGSEDFQRVKSDRFENRRMVTVITFDANKNIIETVMKSKHIKPGDIIKLTGLTQVPVDLLLMLTSNHHDGNKCYIETANIDGETNLKMKEAPAVLFDVMGEQIAAGVPVPELFDGVLEFEGPNKNIHNFVGTLKLNNASTAVPLSTENLILRSSLFSNTDWGYGIAIYTGQETKIQMNNRRAPSKMSKIEHNLNTAIMCIFIAQVILVTISVISIYIMGFDNYDKLPYVFPGGEGSGSVLPLFLEQWFIFFILYNNFIPISLYVTIEMVNLGQSYLIAQDNKMYNEELDVACKVRSSNLAQELGMVSNIFSDKTGTLTRNEMKLLRFVIDGTQYSVRHEEKVEKVYKKGEKKTGKVDKKNKKDKKKHKKSLFGHEKESKIDEHEQLSSDQDAEHNTNSSNSTANNSINTNSNSNNNTKKHVTLTGDNITPTNILAEFGDLTPTTSTKFTQFFRCLTACHTVVREKNGTYRAESPDELALVQGVAGYHCNLLERGTKEMNVELLGEKLVYEVLAVNLFNADRKRMSILVRDRVTHEYIVMCKGADNIMLPLCVVPSDELSQINVSLVEMANMGLRTLVIAQKVLSEEVAHEWLATYKAAALSINDREDKIATAAAQLEQGMDLLGITAIEDRLQDEVPEVIADLAKAGIILWMLTGDKLETAIEIGRSCNLLLNDTAVSMLTKINSKAEFSARLTEEHEKITRLLNPNTALVIDGPSFTYFDNKNPEQRQKLLRIGQGCRSVIACRLTPNQKRELVKLVKTETSPKATTLSIGDGANDVSMILEADVGVGIFGKEGRQAANNADFAIGEFKFLRRLLLVHGRWNYIRQSKVFLYSIHKNMVITLTLFWFSYYTAVSGTTPYESWVYTGFNFILGWPIVFFGIFDRDLSADFCLAHPETYVTGRTDSLLTPHAIALWLQNAVQYTALICLISYYVLAPTFEPLSLYEAGTTVFTGLCLSLQCKVAFFHHQWNYIEVLAMLISVFLMFVYFLCVAAVANDYYYVANETFKQDTFWLMGCFLIPMSCFLLDVIGHAIYLFFAPTQNILFRETEKQDKFPQPQWMGLFGNNKHNWFSWQKFRDADDIEIEAQWHKTVSVDRANRPDSVLGFELFGKDHSVDRSGHSNRGLDHSVDRSGHSSVAQVSAHGMSRISSHGSAHGHNNTASHNSAGHHSAGHHPHPHHNATHHHKTNKPKRHSGTGFEMNEQQHDARNRNSGTSRNSGSSIEEDNTVNPLLDTSAV